MQLGNHSKLDRRHSCQSTVGDRTFHLRGYGSVIISTQSYQPVRQFILLISLNSQGNHCESHVAVLSHAAGRS